MGEVICLRTYRLVRESAATWDEARSRVRYIDFMIWHKRAMDERDRFQGIGPDQSEGPHRSTPKGLIKAGPEDPRPTPAEAP